MQIQFNEILIVESLPSTDAVQSGAELYEHLTAQPGIPVAVSIAQPRTAAELFTVLDSAALRAARGGWFPLIHLEMHGTLERDAVVTASGDRIPWNDISQPLRHLNIAIKNSLIVVLGVCSGAYIGMAAANSPFEPAPFAWLVGPDKPVRGFFLRNGFKAFYRELIASGDFAEAVAALRQYTLPEYTALDTARMFRRGREVYEVNARGAALNTRVKRIFHARRAALVGHYGGNNKARRGVAAQIRDESKWREYYRHFIMADKFPENEQRFPPIAGV